jgi:adenylyltransferase/sulfurtransferase
MDIANFIERFSRQMMLNEIGVKGQFKLLKSKVAIIGCGATGTTVAELLARAGVGFIRVVDRDFVELSNLHRTHLFRESDALEGLPKALVCRQRLSEVNSLTNVEYVIDSVSADNVVDLIVDTDLVIDGSDNIETRLLVNEACISLRKPWVMIGVERWYGMTKFIDAEKGACFRCLVGEGFRRRENVCDVIGVANITVSLTATIATTLALKYLLGLPVEDELFIVDAFDLIIEKIKIYKKPECPACVKKEFSYLNRKGKERVRFTCGATVIEVLPEGTVKIDLPKLISNNIFENIKIFDEKYAYIKIGEYEVLLLSNGKALIRGIRDLSKAEELYNNILRELERKGVVSV